MLYSSIFLDELDLLHFPQLCHYPKWCCNIAVIYHDILTDSKARDVLSAPLDIVLTQVIDPGGGHNHYIHSGHILMPGPNTAYALSFINMTAESTFISSNQNRNIGLPLFCLVFALTFPALDQVTHQTELFSWDALDGAFCTYFLILYYYRHNSFLTWV